MVDEMLGHDREPESPRPADLTAQGPSPRVPLTETEREALWRVTVALGVVIRESALVELVRLCVQEVPRLAAVPALATEREAETVECPDCAGNGYHVETRPVCCGRLTRGGDCCGDPDPIQEQVPCEPCDGYGVRSPAPVASPEPTTNSGKVDMTLVDGPAGPETGWLTMSGSLEAEEPKIFGREWYAEAVALRSALSAATERAAGLERDNAEWRDSYHKKSDTLNDCAAALSAAKAELEDWRNREAQCCPEDVGFDEFITALENRLKSTESSRAAALKLAGEILASVAIDVAQNRAISVAELSMWKSALASLSSPSAPEPTNGV